MRLEDYLKAMENCSDKELTRELGISDNWPILLRADYKKVISDLMNSDNDRNLFLHRFSFFEEIINEEDIRQVFAYAPGTVLVQVGNWDYWLGLGQNQEAQRIEEDIRKKYPTILQLHPYQKDKRIDGVSEIKSVAIVAFEIARYAINNRIPLCFPKSCGENHRDDFSRIVYHKPT